MKKACIRIIGTFIACTMAAAGLPAVTGIDDPFTVNADAASKLAAPKNLKAAVDGTTVTLTWKAVSGADAYRVYKYNETTDEYEKLKNVTSTKCVIKGLSKGTYKFRVAALVKSGSSYKVQTKTTAVSAKVAGKTTNTTSTTTTATTLPKLGLSKDAAIKASGISNGANFNYTADIKVYGGTKKINGTDCSELLYFNESGTYFYGLIILPDSAVKGSTLLSDLRKKNGEELISQESDSGQVYMWADLSTKIIKGIITISNSGGSIYFEMDYSLAPSSMKGKTDGFDFDAISALFQNA